MRSRYSRWDGTQDPLGEHVDVGDVLDRIGDDLLMGAGGNEALQRLLRRGVGDRVAGLDDLHRRVRTMRQRVQDQLDVDGPLADVGERIDEIVDTERGALAGDEGEAARFAELRLDALPSDPGGAIRDLRDYDFTSEQAQSDFDQLLDDLRRDILDSYFNDLSAGIEDLTPDDIARTRRMLADLNEMVEAREAGRPYDFDGFMAEYGEFFPDDPEDLDELLESLARRMAAASRMLAAMSPEQRRQLQDLANTVLEDLDLAFQMTQLGDQLRALMPQLPWDAALGGQPPDGQGEGTGMPAPMSRTLDTIERVGELEELEQALAGDYPGASIEDVDEEALRRELDDEAAGDLRRLKEIERALEESGVLNREAGQLELTPRGARLLGERALTHLLDRIRRQTATRGAGPEAEPTGGTRPWRFGDREPISVQRSIFNAVVRSVTGEAAVGAPEARSRGRSVLDGVGPRPTTGVEVRPEDFAVAEMEVRPRTATALLLDLSFSMPLRGHFVPAKRMALALHALINGKYPQDSLYLIGFSDYARRLDPADLGAEGFERVYGTNMHHAFLLARRLLADDPRPVRQAIMVTDGEPTAHLEGDQALFNWPPVRRTIVRTLKEAKRLSRADIALHVFLLEDEPGLVGFAEKLGAMTDGQVFQTAGDDIGRFVLRDWLGSTRGPVRGHAQSRRRAQ